MNIRGAIIPILALVSLFIPSHTVDGLSLKRRETTTDEEGDIVVEPDRNIDDSNTGDEDTTDVLGEFPLPDEDGGGTDAEQELLMAGGEDTDPSVGSKVVEPERHHSDFDDADEDDLPGDEILPGDDILFEGNTNDFSDVLRRRKRHATWQELKLSREHHPLEVSLVEATDNSQNRVKRTSYITQSSTWPRHIPYVFDKSNSPVNIRDLRNVLVYLEAHLCVTFTLESDFDSSNSNWFKEHGYSTNAYLNFQKSSGCFAYPGRGGKDAGPRPISTCSNYMTMMHEVMHALGALHAQSYPERDRYITVHKGNIIKGMSYNYKPVNAETGKIRYTYFDSHSMLMYYPSDFSLNGQETFNYVRPDMGALYGPSSYQNILLEMTKNYHCVETFCNGTQRDCGVGYFGYVHRKCSCVCPDGYDPESNCQNLINEAPPSGAWPDTPFTLYKAGSKCPTGFEEGLIPVHGIRRPGMTGEAMTRSGNILNLETCTRKASGKVDFSMLPNGSYCVVKPVETDCQEPFKEGSYTINTKTSIETTGAVGDVDVDGTKLTIKFCCNKERNIIVPMKLPIAEPFRLSPYNTGKCQAVAGAWVTPGFIDIFNRKPSFTNIPFALKNSVLLRQMSCYYEPATYGCSEQVNLDANTRSYTISTPGFGVQREGARRCFYAVNVPENSNVRITFNTFSIGPDDLFLLKRYQKWQQPYRIWSYMIPTEIISEGNFMFVEYWSHSAESADYKGVQLTFDLISAENSCFDKQTNGMDYAGDKDISETYEQCLPWKDAVHCEEFPVEDGVKVLQLINSGNKCRNPTSTMLQPWCYTYINDTMCIRRYCDACNDLNPEDKLADCDSKIGEADPNFCTESLARLGCFKSCQMTNPAYNKNDVKCTAPAIPSEIATSDPLSDTYNVGDKVSVSCNSQTSEIECTTFGWTSFSDECVAESCVDASQMCQSTLELDPYFCQDPRFSEISSKQCKKSCGQCGGDVKCTAASTDTVASTSESDSVGPGEVMTFACKEGLHLTGGDVSRACSVSGELLGKETICQDKPIPADVNLMGIRDRRSSLNGKYAMLLDGPAWQTPFKGKVTKWYYYCKSNEPIALLVYRRTSDSSTFQLVGYNEAECVRDWPWSFNVPPDKQISVEAGDLIGAWNFRSTIACYSCSWAKEKPLTVWKAKVPKLNSLVSKPEYSFQETCVHLSIGAHVEPSI